MAKLISGILREVWLADAPLVGGAAVPVTTGIKCSPGAIGRVQAVLTLTGIDGAL